MASPTPKRNPKKVIYVHALIRDAWKLREVTRAWNKAKHTKFVLINQDCPVYSACVTIQETDLPRHDVGKTSFGFTANDSQIELDPDALDPTTLCHELGHILGLGHLRGTKKTCMREDGELSDPNLPTVIDLRWADSLGPWNLDRMYESSQKTLDVRDIG